MRHQLKKRSSFGLRPGPRQALIKGLVFALIENERIKITLPRAKTLRRYVEKAITLGKKANLASRRLLLSRYPQAVAVEKIMNDLSPRFKDREGGYTRITKLNNRAGDSASMAYIEFVDYDPNKPVVKPSKDEDQKKKSEAKKPRSKKDAESIAKKKIFLKKKESKKHRRQMQSCSRRINRPK